MPNRSTSPRRATLVVALGLAVIGAGCHSDSNNVAPRVATSIAVNSGSSGQTGTVGQSLTQAISVHVQDQDGNALAGAVVTWRVVGHGGSVDSATSTASSTGDATVHWTLGTVAGTDSLTAAIASGTAVTITATANAGALAALTKVSGDAQSVAVSSTSQPFVVMAADQYGNAVANTAVTWVVVGGGTLSAATSTTDSSGHTQVTLQTDAAPAAYTITAAAGASLSAVFTLQSN